ncbi:tape measure protein [Methylorubrum extorquens]|uniref:tape measure protein n=1 Tax=Methylorubrum extorquens TaxID=408 RepID=UPI00209D8385|nr:tape measure protein [Methylorubrum extorquens]MCP1540056.1 tape measure domain-containing protein [Methylorubrum extorquens]
MTAIRVELELDDGSFTTRMLRAGQSIQTFERQVGQGVTSINALQGASGSFLGTLRDVTVVLGQASSAINFVRSATTGWASEIIKVNAEFERLRTLLRGMSTAADPLKDANQQLRDLREFARTTPYSLQAITGVFTQMKAAGIDPLKGGMKGLVDAVASFGGSEEVMKRASLAITQMAGKGVIQMEELRQQLGEAVPRATELLARSMGVTYGQLVKAISTGTVESKRALEGLNAEFERTFGGAAQAQMDTWNGLMARLATGMQNLAENTGEAGFFDAAKKGARDLIALMESPQIKGLYDKQGNLLAGGLSQQVGSGLASLVGFIDGAIRKVVEFRGEILEAGTVLVYAFGATKTFQALNAMASSLNVAATQAGVFRRELGAMRAEFALAQTAFAGAGTHMEGFSAIARGAGIGVRGLVVMVAELAPILAIAGAGIMAAAYYFDVFGQKAREARDDVEKFGGAASKQSLDIFRKSVAEAGAELDRLKARRDRLNGTAAPAGNARRTGDVVYGGEISAKEKELAKAEQLLRDASFNAEVAAGERLARTRLDALANQATQVRRMRDLEATKAEETQRDALARETAAKRSTSKLEEDYKNQTKARALAVLDDQITIYQRGLEEAQKAAVGKTGIELQQQQAVVDGAKRQLETLRAQREAEEARARGVPITSKLVDEQKLLEKGGKALDNLKAGIAGSRAALAGMSAEVYELQTKLADGKFGPVDNGKVQELIAQLIQAQAEKSKLDELLAGKQAFDKDVSSLRLKAEQDLFEAQNRNATAYDKLIIKLNSGGYAGVGNGATPMERAMIAMRTTVNAVGEAAVAAGNSIRTSFGTTAAQTLDTLKEKAEGVANAFKGIGAGAGSVSFPNIAGAVTGAGSTGVGGAGTMDAVSKNLSAAARVFLNAISGPESGGRYNVRYTPSGGATFDSYDQHPRIYERTKDGKRSSAAGRYQIVYDTWKSLGMEGQPFTPENQDMAAWKLAKQDYRRNTGGGDLEAELVANGFSEKIVQALQGTWEALQSGKGAQKSRNIWNGQWDTQGDRNTVQRDSSYRPRNANDPVQAIPENIAPIEARKLDEARKLIQSRNQAEFDNGLVDAVKTLTENMKEAESVADGYGKRVSALRKQIERGDYGADKSPESERYKKALQAAELLDEAEAKRAKNQKDRSRIASNEEARERESIELAERAAALKRNAANGTDVSLSDSYYRKMAENERVLEAAKRLQADGHKDFTEDKVSALAQSQADSMRKLRDVEVSEMLQAERKKTEAVERENMTADQARQAAYEAEVRRQNGLVSMTEEGTEARAQAEVNASRRIAAERAKLANASPVQRQMKEWADLGNNMEKAMTGWMDSAADGLADFITTGKADFASLFQSIAKDITKMGLKYMMSQMFGGAKGGAGGGMGGLLKAGTAAATGGASKGAGGLSMLFGAMHTGGVVGDGFSMTRNVSPSVFSGAPRFHTGGVIGHDEVPIIAQRGEGVFTKAQMAAMGGASAPNIVTIAPAITVNASGGTPEQNADLAQQTAKAAEGMIRGIVANELRSQMRPGNMLNQ